LDPKNLEGVKMVQTEDQWHDTHRCQAEEMLF